MGVAFLLLGIGLPLLIPTLSGIWKILLAASTSLLGVVLLIAAYFVAKNSSSVPQGRGGDAGTGIAAGDYSEADGGAGGAAKGGMGGKGGNALASGKGARAKGGAGGSG